MKNPKTEPEFSRLLVVDKIPPHGSEHILEAKDEELKNLTKRFDLLGMSKLWAQLTVHPAGLDQTVAVSGKIIADVIQQCVVTLEPLPAHVEHELDVLFMPAEAAVAGAGPSDADEDEVETIMDGTIDLGELAAQYLGIALDPYPRKAGVSFVDVVYGEEEVKKPLGPLAQLANWPKKPKDSR